MARLLRFPIRVQGAFARFACREARGPEGVGRRQEHATHSADLGWEILRYTTTEKFQKQLSCAFTEERVKQYEELNKSFVPTTKLPAPAAAAKIIPLMIMDMAYLKSFDVDWDGACPALDTPAVADDDDDNDIDTSAWDVTDPSTIPFNNLRIPRKGKLPTALLYAASLLAVAEPRPQNVGRWISALVDRFNELKAQTSSNDLNDIITRPMTAHEEEM